jgi:pyruvyl transferase EpsO
MDLPTKLFSLRELIDNSLLPLIDRDYVLLDLPYHKNTGDMLIWEGETSFLSKLPYKCLYKASFHTYDFNYSISPDTLILLHGGGNFGDLWRVSQSFRLHIIEKYPHNNIIIFPQTVFYESENLLRQDAKLLSAHANLTICARDKVSYDILKAHFDNHILLVPDMAFCIPPDRLLKHAVQEKEEVLFVKRKDKELNPYCTDFIPAPHSSFKISDWPSFERKLPMDFILHISFGVKKLLVRCLIPRYLLDRMIDIYAERIYKPLHIRMGVRFISRCSHIYTTRLHAAILSALLCKPFSLLDNSYGKNRNFYETWLSDVEAIRFIYDGVNDEQGSSATSDSVSAQL